MVSKGLRVGVLVGTSVAVAAGVGVAPGWQARVSRNVTTIRAIVCMAKKHPSGDETEVAI